MNKFILFPIVILFLFSCAKETNTLFTLPSKVKYTDIELLNLERFVVKDTSTLTYVQISDRNELLPELKMVYFQQLGIQQNHIETFEFNDSSKVKITGTSPGGGGSLDYHYILKDNLIHIYDKDPNVYFELIQTSDVDIKLVSIVRFNNAKGIWDYETSSVIGDKPSKDEFIKGSITKNKLQVNDTIYINRFNSLYKAY